MSTAPSDPGPDPHVGPQSEPAGPGEPARRLRRSDKGKVIAGVAAGIADYLNVDVGVVRLLFAIFAVFGGAGVWLYLVGWAVIPPPDGSEPFAETTLRKVRESFSSSEKPGSTG